MSLSALLKNDLISWGKRRTSAISVASAVFVVGMGVMAVSTRAPLFATVLGGPAIATVNGQLREGPDWTWFVTNALFVVTMLSLTDTRDAWVDLTLTRGITRTRWAMARLGALITGALIFMAALICVLEITILIGWRSNPLITSTTAWDLGMWTLDLVALGWFALALDLWLGTPWWSLMLTWLMLGLARFGGEIAPYIPFSQSIVALHHLPGTFSIASGGVYLGLWTVASGVAVLWWSLTQRR